MKQAIFLRHNFTYTGIYYKTTKQGKVLILNSNALCYSLYLTFDRTVKLTI